MGTECEARLRFPPAQLPERGREEGSRAVPSMGNDWKRACDNLTLNYNRVKKKSYFSAIGEVWKHPATRSNYGMNHLYSNQFQQITPDCNLELDLSSMYRNGSKSETDLTKNDVLLQTRNKESYKMLIQHLEELSMMRHGSRFRKLYRPESDSEEVTKNHPANQLTKQVCVNKSRGNSREEPGKHQREILINSDQEKFKHLPNSLTTSDPPRRMDDLSGFTSNVSTLNSYQREELLQNDCHKVESKPIDTFRYGTESSKIKTNNQNFFFPLWILKPAKNETDQFDRDLSETENTDNAFPPSYFQQSCLDLSPEVVEADNVSSSYNHEQGDNVYPYPEFLPPPFNRLDFSELSMLENCKWKDDLPARPNRALEQLLDRFVQMEKMQFMTIQKEKSRITGILPSTAANTSSPRKNTKRSRKSRQCDLICVQPPRVEVCFKKTNPAKLDKHKYLYRIGSSHSSNDPQDSQLPNDDQIFKRRLRANCNAYKHFRRSTYSSNRIILSRTASDCANTEAFAAVKSVKPLPVQKPSNSSPCKYKKKQKEIQAALGKAIEGKASHCFLSREMH
ncbi:uncharacterized protein [Heptranchias perlo]|uniref:uncharacterized protein n=1 Tax=Heptranchias perlo TaxID=212740 RepID=UPI003559AEA0